MSAWQRIKWWFFRLRPRIIKWPKKTLKITTNNAVVDNAWFLKCGWRVDELVANQKTCEQLAAFLCEENGYTIAEVVD